MLKKAKIDQGAAVAPAGDPNGQPTAVNKRRSQRGNAMIEFAIAWSMLWLLFSGVYQYGYAFYIYNRLMTAVANAAELAAKMNYDTADTSAFTTAVQNMVLYGDESAGSSTIVPGLTASQVNVSITTTGGSSIPTDVTITIGSTATPYTIDAFFGSVSLTGKPRATVKYYGTISCSTC